MRQISVEIIQKCPNMCLHCSSYADRNCTWEMKTDVVRDIIDSAAELQTNILSISGGEPFLHDGLLEIVDYAKDKGIAVYIYTSGIGLNKNGQPEPIKEEMIGELHNLSVDKIIFDIPAIHEKVYDTFMGTKGYQRVAFESLKRMKSVGIFTEIHFVPTKINIGEIDAVLAFAKKMNVDRVSFLAFVPHGRAVCHLKELLLNPKEKADLKSKLKLLSDYKVRVGIPLRLEAEDGCCYAGTNKLFVRYDGKVFGCEAFKYVQLIDEQKHIVMPDSIYNDSLVNIFKTSRYLQYEKQFIKKQMNKDISNEKCPVQRFFWDEN